jgi:NADH-quinone oxidoreductase subunit H
MVSELNVLSQIFIAPGFLLLISLALFYQWLDRKLVARFQNRRGPQFTGVFGIFQPFADFVKLLSKEFIIPTKANSYLFQLTPIIYLSICFIGMFTIPIIYTPALMHFEGDLILIITIFTIISITIFFCAWGSTGVYSVIGGTRAALQLLVFEIPLGIVMMGPAIIAKSLSLSQIVGWQQNNTNFIFLQPLGLVTFIICLLAELEVIPFDIPIAKGEIVEGWKTEFNGRGLALISLGADVELLLSSSLITTLYLGGPSLWILPPILGFLIKTTVVIFIFSLLKSLFARFRLDQILRNSWGLLVPMAIIQIILIEVLR